MENKLIHEVRLRWMLHIGSIKRKLKGWLLHVALISIKKPKEMVLTLTTLMAVSSPSRVKGDLNLTTADHYLTLL